jgi:hypothetical protein
MRQSGQSPGCHASLVSVLLALRGDYPEKPRVAASLKFALTQ